MQKAFIYTYINHNTWYHICVRALVAHNIKQMQYAYIML